MQITHRGDASQLIHVPWITLAIGANHNLN